MVEDREATGADEADAGPDGQLTPAQVKLLAELVGNPDMAPACESVGISRATGYRWSKRPAFREELDRQRNEVLTESLAIGIGRGLAASPLPHHPACGSRTGRFRTVTRATRVVRVRQNSESVMRCSALDSG
jgi:hypothetical protein